MNRFVENIWQERMLAFSGVCLAAVCVQQLARRGEVTPVETADTLINSVLTTEPEDTEAVYGELTYLRPGLQVVLRQLDNQGDKDVEQTRYVVGMLHLQRKLIKSNPALNRLSDSLTQIKRQRDEFSFDESAIIANLGSLYSDIISPLGPRIQISGSPNNLKQTHIQQKIRALLLAGIRSAVLWGQLDGKRRQVIFNRKQMVTATRELLANIS